MENMRKIILYIASSLDGKIADQNGGVEWLESIPNPEKSDYGYLEFLNSIDTTIMGNMTYRQVLGFDIGNPYKDKKNYVLTRDKSLARDDYVEYISEDIVGFIRQLKSQPGKDIWCVGGGETNSLLLNHGLLDEIRIFIMPIILGKGLPVTSELGSFTDLELVDLKKHSSGVVEINYKPKRH
jgi:dihydrofolate reductase